MTGCGVVQPLAYIAGGCLDSTWDQIYLWGVSTICVCVCTCTRVCVCVCACMCTCAYFNIPALGIEVEPDSKLKDVVNI